MTDKSPCPEEYQPVLRAAIAESAGELIPILQAVQRLFGFLPRNVLEYVSEQTNIPPARIWGVATFYSGFSLTPRGRHIVRVCQGTACHVRGSPRIMEALAKEIGVDIEGGTSDDLEHTLDTVACVGCCSLAPVVTIGAEIYGKLDQRKAVDLVLAPEPDEEEQ